jgi:hypothetical protein
MSTETIVVGGWRLNFERLLNNTVRHVQARARGQMPHRIVLHFTAANKGNGSDRLSGRVDLLFNSYSEEIGSETNEIHA